MNVNSTVTTSDVCKIGELACSGNQAQVTILTLRHDVALVLLPRHDVSRCTDLVAGSAESGKNNFPLDFPPDNFVLGCSKCQKWILRGKINFPSTAEHFFRSISQKVRAI